MNEEKEGEKEKISQFPISAHTARALCTWLWEKERKKERARRKKVRAENEEKKKYIEKKGEYGELPFWEYWVLPRNIYTIKKVLK